MDLDSTWQVALILLGETLFGPFWVWVAYGDVPDGTRTTDRRLKRGSSSALPPPPTPRHRSSARAGWTLAGGSLLLLTLIGHELAGMVEMRKAAEAAAAHATTDPRLPPFVAEARAALGSGGGDFRLEYIGAHRRSG